jgi:glycosyltransferase involved in cell wall biosynthesis
MDAIAVLLPEYQDWYSGTLRARTSVVPNPVEPVAPEILAGAERCKTILAVGRLADTKRHDLTLRAFAILSPDFPEWRLKIFGVGPFEERLNDLRDELGLLGRAELPGHTTTIRDEYLSASILCHPARFEGFPLAVTESLASGVPVVGFSDCSGVNSLVVDGENGVLVDPGDGSDDGRLRALTEALRILMSDDAYRKSLSERGPESMEPYRPARVADRWEQVLFPE